MDDIDVDAIVSGVLFDFMGFLTTRKQRLVLSAADDAAPAVEAIKEFVGKNDIELADPEWLWAGFCAKKLKKENTEEILDKRPHHADYEFPIYDPE